METLSKLFGNKTRVKLLRLFLFNSDQIFDIEDIKNKTRSSIDILRKEIRLLESIDLIKKRSFFGEFEKKIGRNKKIVKKRIYGWTLDEDFIFLRSLQQFFIRTATLRERDLLKQLRRAGKLNLVIISGFFIQDWESRLDILIVGDKINDKKLENEIRNIESELGVELRYSVFSTHDFKYRLGIRDKLIRDILDYSHRILVDSLGMSDI